MGCDIVSVCEVYDGTRWVNAGGVFPLDSARALGLDGDKTNEFYRDRNYGLFGFLAGVRNYFGVPVIADRRGLPNDLDDIHGWREYCDCDDASWLLLGELLAFDYSQTFDNNYYGISGEGDGARPTLRDFLPAEFFESLELMKTLGDPGRVRIVFWFE